MVKAGDTIENPVTGDKIRFIKTTAETDGELLEIEYIMTKPGGSVPLHIHRVAEERFTTTQGRLGVRLGKNEQILEVGQSVVIPPRTLHRFWNPDTTETRFLTEIRPALEFQTYFETMFGLARDGKVNRDGLPNPLQLFVLAEVADSYTANAPDFVVDTLIRILAPLARRQGYRARYPAYSD